MEPLLRGWLARDTRAEVQRLAGLLGRARSEAGA